VSAVDTNARLNEVYRQLVKVIDPEVGASIAKLGLIYDILLEGDDVTVVMTLTTQGCPMERALTAGVERVVRELSWVGAVTVRLVWEPPWDPGMIR